MHGQFVICPLFLSVFTANSEMEVQKWPSKHEKLHSVKKSITFALRKA